MRLRLHTAGGGGETLERQDAEEHLATVGRTTVRSWSLLLAGAFHLIWGTLIKLLVVHFVD